MKRLLLISNSTLHGSGYLDHCAEEIKSFLGESIKTVLFIPYARPGGISLDGYTETARKRYAQMGYEVVGIHESKDPIAAVESAEAIFTGGGNTFILLDGLQSNGLIEPIRKRISDSMPYIGTSAGSNAACPTIKTTNDMPIREPESFEALNVFPYQINPHYLDPAPNSTHKGETRETRIKEFLAFNIGPVIGLREGCMIHVEGEDMWLKGSTGARIMRRGEEALELKPVCKLEI